MNYTNMKSYCSQPLTTCDGHSINNVSTTKLLGMELCANLKWDTHYSGVLAKASRRLYILRQLRRARCPTPWIWNAYNAFIRSIISYGFPAACNVHKQILLKLILLERRAIIIIGSPPPGDTISEHLEKMCIRLAKQAAKSSSHPLNHLFKSTTARDRRKIQKFEVPLCKTVRYRNSLVKYHSQI